jgi:hypothetical protein
MACLNLSNGNFTLTQFSPADVNAGDVTIEIDGQNSINIEHANFAGNLFMNGRWEQATFGNNSFVALLRFIPGAPGSSQRTIFIVDFTGANIDIVQVHEQGTVQDSTARPQLMLSPGGQTLAFVFSATGNPNEMQRLAIVRSDNGDLVLAGPLTVTGVNGTIGARVTASELIIDHPNQFGNDDTTAPRPAGECNIVDDNPDFGEAVLGAADPSLATVTQAVTIRNDGNDCLTINAIANNAPYTVTAATLAQLPVVLDPGAEFDASIRFAPAAPGNYDRDLAVTTTPPNGDDTIACEGEARMAIAQISTSVGALNFGTIVHPATVNDSFNVTNSGEIDVTIDIAGAPGGSDFTWTTATAQALPVGGAPFQVNVTFTTPGDGPATPRTITIDPSQGANRQVNCTGAGCIPNAVIAAPPAAPLDYGQIERGFRTVRFIEIRNDGDTDLTFTARIAPAADPAHAALFGLVLPDNDITDAPSQRPYAVLPAVRCGPGATGNNVMPVAVSFFADGANGVYSANLVIENSNDPAAGSFTYPLSGEVIDPIPVDIALVLDCSGSMNDPAWSRNKMEAALSGGKLLVQMLRDSAPDRCALVSFNELPNAPQPIQLVAGNQAALVAALGPPAFVPGGWTNIAGGAIVGAAELATAHPGNPPVLKKAMVVLTDGIENRCFQIGGAGTWYSITGRDADEDMARPDGTPQNTDPWPPPQGVKVYAIGLGAPGDIDEPALTTLASTTGASYQGAQDLTGKDYFLLEKYFTQIFMETAGLAQIADPFFTIAPGAKHAHEFDILPGDVNAMVVLYDEPGHRLPFHIESPAGEILSGASLPAGFAVRHRSTPTARFAEFYFPSKQPNRYVGRWTVWVEHPGYVCAGDVGKDPRPGFLPRKCEGYKKPVDYGIAIGAGSNLRMQPYVEPGVKYIGESFRLNAEVSEAGLPVKGSTVRVRVTAPTGQQYVVPLLDDGAHQDGQADDGDYGGVFTQTYVAGNYQLEFRAEGMQGNKSYTRTAHRTKAVYDKRNPPGGGGGDDGRPGGGGSGGDCCRRLLRALARQEALLRELLKAQGRAGDDKA